MSQDRRFYVYEWYNIDTDSPFYVGKGTENRYKETKGRNSYFLNYINKYQVGQRIIKDNLTQQEAFDMQKNTIKKYKQMGIKLTNLTDGGQGCSGRQVDDSYRLKYHYMCLGQNNPNYGHKWTQQMKDHLSQIAKNRNNKNENNPNSKKVMCVETQEIFDTVKDAAQICDVKSYTSISHALNKPNRIASGYHWITV